MSRIEPKALQCPMCGAAVDGHVVTPSPDRGPVTSDLRRYGSTEDPIPFLVNLCPECGYSAEALWFEALAPRGSHPVPAAAAGAFFDQASWDDHHDPILAADRPVDEGSTLRTQVDHHLRPRAQAARNHRAMVWENAAQVARWVGAGPLREGDAMLRAAWLWEDAGATEAGTRCRARACSAYEAAMREQKGFRRREDLVVVAYLCGELHRRLGRADAARRWFEQAVAWSSGLPKLQDLVALAERQMRDPRELA